MTDGSISSQDPAQQTLQKLLLATHVILHMFLYTTTHVKLAMLYSVTFGRLVYFTFKIWTSLSSLHVSLSDHGPT